MRSVKSMKDRLMEIILEKSFQYSEEPIFKLVSGGVSNFYFNCKPTMLDPEGKELIGRLIFSTIRDLQVAVTVGVFRLVAVDRENRPDRVCVQLAVACVDD